MADYTPTAISYKIPLPRLTWQVFNVHTTKVAESILVVGGMVANNAVVFARQIIKAAVNRRHSWQIVEDFLNLFDDFLEAEK